MFKKHREVSVVVRASGRQIAEEGDNIREILG
jgi:hypothetical protein